MEDNSWISPGMREAEFWREGMSPEEYDEENEYIQVHYDTVKNGTHLPLWRQRELGLIPPREEKKD